MTLHAPRKYNHQQQHPTLDSNSPLLTPPPPTNILGTWYITRSSSPFWADKHDVTITLSTDKNTGPIAIKSLRTTTIATPTPVITNTTSYQTLSSESVKSTAGTDRVVPSGSKDGNGDEGSIMMEWRGSGWLRVASARWEILGWGGEGNGDEWMVVFADKSMFTPMGISLYSRSKGGVGEEAWGGIEWGLKGLVECSGDEEFRGLVEGIRVVRQD